ncbi:MULTISPECIES: SDR family oxidoreductase [unclassified Paracoccus (in: a-proteobacteria)]|uniref:SDR family oxidoreductase n=1 Tax=unclassified Paracoccus (in: a-proteobacteria) TaxID=2688777 RepID=UPI0012B207CF|nr:MULTISPECIES: SDR family oxidoreductase [unclassified Paracoccus (in: a-proteobacteria)]UXU75515.1 SDR family oxidoreductase [Paracoccus sp. SMMA_5]UXU81420.1 SDR family oxidoreductase [Paracoccus sp. SMMA_5_TC]
MQLTGFRDRAALVTGAAGGIGRAVVEALSKAGAYVIATDTAAALQSAPLPGIDCRPMDVRDAEAVTATVADIVAEQGSLPLGVHAAGVLSVGPITRMSAEEWHRVIDVNLTGTFHVAGALGRAMAQAGGGAIVAVSSNAAGIPRMNMGAYAASKAAVSMLIRCLGLELASRGVRCNIVAPGSTLTPMQTGMWDHRHGHGEEQVIAGDLAQFRTGIPLGKLASPGDIAQAVMYLLSEQAGHVTMADLYVDGGATLRA